MPQARPYHADKGLSAAFHDEVTAADAELAGDIDRYAALVPAGGPVLELGSGSGRVAIALAGRGFAVTGVEIAPAMLAQARGRTAALSPEVSARIDLRRGDMTGLDLAGTFDAVICPFFGLAHLPAGRRGATPSPASPPGWPAAGSRPSTCRDWRSCACRRRPSAASRDGSAAARRRSADALCP